MLELIKNKVRYSLGGGLMVNNKKQLFVLFLMIFGFKAFVSFYMKGPFIFSDESCVTQTAMYFAENFKLASCLEITGMPEAGTTTMPIYSLIISPVYILFKGLSAYYAILVLNSLLFSSLVYPLYYVFNVFLKNKKAIVTNILLTLFMASTFIYEKILMPEGIFIILNVWFLYFYLKSFQKGKFQYKILALVISILAVFSRPFGFIVPLSFALNELVLAKKKKRILFIVALVGTMSFIVAQKFNPGLLEMLEEKFYSLGRPDNVILLMHALKNQINSLTISTFFIAFVLFLQFFKTKDVLVGKIKYFLMVFITINMLISAQHIYGYFLDAEPLHLLTRYINMSTVYIYIFAFIFIADAQKVVFGRLDKVLIIIMMLSMLFLDHYGKFPQNLDLVSLYTVIGQDKSVFFYQINLILVPIFMFFLFCAIKNRKYIIQITLSVILVIQSMFSIYWLHNTQSLQYTISSYFLDMSDKKITYIVTPEYGELPEYWKTVAITDNKVDYKAFYSKDEVDNYLFYVDYLVSTYDLKFPLVYKNNNVKIFKYR